MRLTPPRVPPVSPDSATDEQKALLNGWWRDLNFSRVMAQHPALYQVFVPVIEKVIARTNLPPRDRQILVLRTLALCEEVYESTHHAHISHGAGLTEADIEAARTDGASLSPFEHVLVKAASELVRGHCISDATWAALGECYSQVQKMEVVGLVGTYTMLAMIMRSYGVQLETPEELDRLQAQRKYK
jgi:alkylhydroperoxidase family enzyme